MRTIAKLFGRSPFVPLTIHMEKVAECVHRLEPILDAYLKNDPEEVNRICQEINHLEHEADELKHDIQSQLPRGMFLPVDRERLLEILAIQDNLADKAENIAVLLTLRRSPAPTSLLEPLHRFVAKNLEAFAGVRKIIGELEGLLSSGFGGAEAENVRRMVMHVAKLEFEADGIQRELLKILFANEEDLSVSDFFLWDKVLQQISELSNLSERLAHRLQRTLELK